LAHPEDDESRGLPARARQDESCPDAHPVPIERRCIALAGTLPTDAAISANAVSSIRKHIRVARSGFASYDEINAGRCIPAGFFAEKEGGKTLKVDATKMKIREILSVRLNLSTAVEKIADDAPLFGPGSIGLDSIDALELVLGIQKEFGVAIEDRALAVKVLVSIDTIAEYLKSRSAGNPEAASGLGA
jgi:acyl carrier protein